MCYGKKVGFGSQSMKIAEWMLQKVTPPSSRLKRQLSGAEDRNSFSVRQRQHIRLVPKQYRSLRHHSAGHLQISRQNFRFLR